MLILPLASACILSPRHFLLTCWAPTPDVDECRDGSAHCHADADCINFPGNYTCHCKDGFAGNGYSCVDSRPPSLSFSALVRTAVADTDPRGAAVAFPDFIVSDSVSPASAIATSCNASLGGAPPAPVMAKGHFGETLFPLGATPVTCVARDAAGNPSGEVSFTVVVVCRDRYTPKDGACTGERGRQSERAGGSHLK
jgi:hypothetical protein